LKGINLNSVIVDEKIMQDNESWENKYNLYNESKMKVKDNLWLIFENLINDKETIILQ
jgi:hypothetical protein